MKKLDTFIKRLHNIGVEIKLSLNFPWIYLDTINNKRVTEKFNASHGFCIGFYPIREGQVFEFLDTKEMFKLIRKYI